MSVRRSDLILEAAENLSADGKIAAELPGVRTVKSRRSGYDVTAMHITAPEASEVLGKPIGRYVTLDLRPYFQRRAGFFALPAA